MLVLMLKRLFKGGMEEKKAKPPLPSVFSKTDFCIRYRVGNDVWEMADDDFVKVDEPWPARDVQQWFLCEVTFPVWGHVVTFKVRAPFNSTVSYYHKQSALSRDPSRVSVSDVIYFPGQVNDFDAWTEFSRRLKRRLVAGYQMTSRTPQFIMLCAYLPRDPSNPDESMYALESRAPELLSRADFVLAALGCDTPIK